MSLVCLTSFDWQKCTSGNKYNHHRYFYVIFGAKRRQPSTGSFTPRPQTSNQSLIQTPLQCILECVILGKIATLLFWQKSKYHSKVPNYSLSHGTKIHGIKCLPIKTVNMHFGVYEAKWILEGVFKASLPPVWPDLVIYWTLSNFLKPLVTIDLPKSSTFLGNFWKCGKIYHFSSEIIFRQLL